MKKYSRVYKHQYGKDTRHYRYNYDDSCLEYVCKPDDYVMADLKDEAENCRIGWLRQEAIDNLRSIEDTGWMVVLSEGLCVENWKEDKNYWMDVLSEDMACEMAAAGC